MTPLLQRKYFFGVHETRKKEFKGVKDAAAQGRNVLAPVSVALLVFVVSRMNFV